MNRLTAPWTSALATAALLALPAAAGAQTPQQAPPEPQPQQSTTPSTPAQQSDSAAEHLRLAKAALAAVDVNSVPARAKPQLTALRRHISSLERSVGANDKASATGESRRSYGARTKRAGASWANDVAAIDRIITQLAGDASTTGAAEPGGVGTTGSKSKGSTAVTLDENTRNQLLEVRKHVTEFAAAMSGTSSKQSSAAPSQQQPTPSAAAETAAATGQTSASSTGPGQASSTSAGQATSSTTGTTGQATTSSSQPAPTGTTGTTGQPGTPTPEQQAETTPANQPGVDPEAAKQHLTAARNSLTQLTQLPAAAQLQGEARTHVSQLIQNFNELITTQTEWRTAYDKVEANLTALIGPAPQKSASAAMPSTDPAAAPTPTPTPEPAPANPPSPPATPTEPPVGTQGTQQPGAVGTSGTTSITLDPAIRQKLTEFREHLAKFHEVAGGEAK